MGTVGGHAVVLGASIGGLLAARTLADFYEHVTVVERDELPADARDRQGIPQGRHMHTLLERGARTFEDMFPGLVEELAAAGAPRAHLLREVRLVLSGHELARADTGAAAIQMTRPLLETTVRTRVAALTNVKIVDNHDVVGVQAVDGRVVGARIRNRATDGVEETVRADLVVDAMGRAGRAATWLADLGYEPPTQDRIKIDMAYVSRFLRMPPGALAPDRQLLVGPLPGRPRGFGLAEQEGGRWLFTLVGMAGDVPPHLDEEAYFAFAESVSQPDVYAALRAAEPVTEFATFRFPTSIRRRYERLRRFPPGLLVFGDAICSFNPVYGQGMTVAALEATALRECLQHGDDDLARRFFRSVAKVIDPVWQLNAGGDLALPEIEGHRPLATRLINRYVARLHRVAVHDKRVAATFSRVAGLLDPPGAILAPGILLRVFLGGRKSRSSG
ncbi:FAD-dependent oxidoreductase [Micromonospora sp. NPDC004704]